MTDAFVLPTFAPAPPTGECACGAALYQGDRRCTDCIATAERKADARSAALRIAGATIPEDFAFTRAGFDDELVRACVRDAAALERAKAATGWVLLRGPTGAGKSTTAAAIAWAAAKAGIAPTWASAIRVASAVQRASLGSEPPEVHAAIRAPLLVVDDLGSEPVIATSPIVEILHARHERARRTIVTTWCDLATLRTRYGDGIARRLHERAIVIELRPRGAKT